MIECCNVGRSFVMLRFLTVSFIQLIHLAYTHKQIKLYEHFLNLLIGRLANEGKLNIQNKTTFNCAQQDDYNNIVVEC